MTTPTFPRETNEFLPVTVTVNGVPVTSGVTFSSVLGDARPVTFVAAVVLGPLIGIQVVAKDVGLHTIFARVTGAGETPVINCGQYRVN